MQEHDLSGKERFRPETRHMITLEVQKDCFVGFKGERFRFYLSDEGYRNAKHSEQEGEIRIKSHAAVAAGKLYPDLKAQTAETVKRAEKQKAGKLPSERGRNYTPLWEVVHCALRTADDFHRFSICSNHHRGSYTSPALALPATHLWTCQTESPCVASCFRPTSFLKSGYTFFMR